MSNQQFLSNITGQIYEAKSCSELREVHTKAISALTTEENAIVQQLAKLNPLLELLDPPNIDNIVTWASKVITLLIEPMVAAIPKYEAQETAVSTAKSQIDAQAEAKAKNFPNCEL